MTNPTRPFVAILGGAKVSEKIEVVENLMKIADAMLIGGGMAYTFLKADGQPIGKSLVEDDKLDLARRLRSEAQQKKFALLLPVDHVVGAEFKADTATQTVSVSTTPDGWMGLDKGPKTIEAYRQKIAAAKTIVWNGPMGVFEMPAFAKGTLEIAKAVGSEIHQANSNSMLDHHLTQFMQVRTPALVVFQVFGHMFAQQNVTGIAAIHHPLRNVNTSAGDVGALVNVGDFVHRAAVNSHPELKTRRVLQRPGDFQRALGRSFRTVAKNQCNTVTGR